MTYKAAFFPHIRWGIWSNHYGWLPFQPVSTNQHLLRSRGRSPGLQTSHSIIGSDPNVWDFLLEPKRENFSAKIRFCSFAGSSEQNQQRRPDVQWNAGWGGGSQSQQLSATAMLCLQLGRPKRPSDAEKVQQTDFDAVVCGVCCASSYLAQMVASVSQSGWERTPLEKLESRRKAEVAPGSCCCCRKHCESRRRLSLLSVASEE